MKPRWPTLCGRKVAPGRALGGVRAGGVEPEGPGSRGHRGQKTAHRGRGAGLPGVPLISPVEGGQQGEDLGSGAEEPGVPGHAPGGPGVFVVDLAEDVPSRNKARFRGGVKAVFCFRFSVFCGSNRLGRSWQGVEPQGFQPQGPVNFFLAEAVQGQAGDRLHHRLQEHEPQVAVKGDGVRGVLQGRGRGQARQEAAPGLRRGLEDFLIKRRARPATRPGGPGDWPG